MTHVYPDARRGERRAPTLPPWDGMAAPGSWSGWHRVEGGGGGRDVVTSCSIDIGT